MSPATQWRKLPRTPLQNTNANITGDSDSTARQPAAPLTKNGQIDIGTSPSSFDTTVRTAPSLAAPEHGRRLGSGANPNNSTAPNTSDPSTAHASPADRHIKAYSQQPSYPVALFEDEAEPAAAAVAALAQQPAEPLRRQNNLKILSSPFRSRAKAAPATAQRLGRPSAARLWNPTNSTPRAPERRRPRSSSPPLPPIPLQHPTLDVRVDASDPTVVSASDYPLLSLLEQRQTRHSYSTRASLAISQSANSDRRVSLPKSVRLSGESQPPVSRTAEPLGIAGDSSRTRAAEKPFIFVSPREEGKQDADMVSGNEDHTRVPDSRDLERGPDAMEPRISNVSAGDGIGSALSSSNSSIMGEDVHLDAGGQWGPQHPCYPHLNPHVPLNSMEYATTRIIRIKRDWLVAGDLAPTFSNLYPEILDPAGVSEQEFRRIIDKLNGELIPIFDPFSFRNMLDSILGLVTGWLWDDLGLTAAKSRLHSLENWVERWNQEMEKTMASDAGTVPPKLISLRQTAYMTVSWILCPLASSRSPASKLC